MNPRYRLEQLLGSGGSASVWRSAVAVKRAGDADPAIGNRRLRREADVLRRLRHPNVIRLIEVAEDTDGGLSLVLEHAPGGSLAALLRHRGELAPGEAAALAARIAGAALASAHAAGIVHGDVCPANILFGANGEPLLADFGSAEPGCGTEGFAAPEVVHGAAPGFAADVFGLAAVVRACCPCDARLAAAVAPALVDHPDTRPSVGALRDALLAALPASAVVLPTPSIGLGELKGDEPVTRRFGPRPGQLDSVEPSSEPGHPRRLLILLAGVVALLVGSAVAVASRGGSDDCPHLPAANPDTVVGDLDGDGCDSAGAFDGRVLTIDGHRYELGRAGDTLLLGDWDCDGRDTPALYRPASGVVVYYDRWSDVGASASPSAYGRTLIDGIATTASNGGCEQVVATTGSSPEG